MSNGNEPRLSGWQHVTLEIAKLVIPLIGLTLAGLAAKWSHEGKEESSAAHLRAKEAEKRAYDIQVHQRKMIIGAVPPEPIKETIDG